MSVENDNNSISQFLSLKSIQDILECIICLDLPRKNPIYQCDNGHLLCLNCHKKVTECPLCKLDLRKNRALAVEKILQKCPRACKFQDNGCSVLMQQVSLEEHEINCNFKPSMPSKLSSKHKSRYIDILSDYECKYNHKEATGVSRDYNCGCVQADNPIPSNLDSIYYFEAMVISEGKEGEPAIGIGLTVDGSLLSRMPGWDEHTIAYHSDDGKFYYNCTSTDDYGPSFGTNDVVGCGLDLSDMSVFFTKNGKFLGVVQCNLPEMTWYPTIGTHSKNEMVQVNFGQDPFVFQLESLSGKSSKNRNYLITLFM